MPPRSTGMHKIIAYDKWGNLRKPGFLEGESRIGIFESKKHLNNPESPDNSENLVMFD